VGPFGLGNGTFDSDMIDLSVIVMVLSLGVEIGVGTSSNCKDCTVVGESFRLLWRFLDLWQGWWQ
jgi:hypothetical protein